MSTTTETAVKYDRDADGIVTLTLDDPNASANTMNAAYAEGMAAAVERLYSEADSDNPVKGVIVTSAKDTFFAGGNLELISQATPADAERLFDEVESMKATLRKLETYPKPVVAAINGAALGGGLEIALTAQRRIAVDGKYKIGLPEATLGLLPGGGGVTRTVRMFGIQTALMDVLLQGTQFNPDKALEKGLVDELVGADELLSAAKAWLVANADDEDAALNPWDKKGYKLPGGTPSNPKFAQNLPAFPPMLRQQLKQADYPAQHAIMSAAVEGAQVDFDTASRIESRYFTNLAIGQNAKNMIKAFFYDLQAITKGSQRPDGFDTYVPRKVGVLGGGMMGAGIAYVYARNGAEVVIKDVSVEAAEKGKSYTAGLNEKSVSRGKLTQEKADEILGRITATDKPEDFAGVDTVIEAVPEIPDLKVKVFNEIMPFVNDDAVLCTNTSTLPITDLAQGVERKADFIGLHFFSPVDKMPLVEIIAGEETGDRALAAAFDLTQFIKKTPIVVNDSRGFYTSRVIGTVISEGLTMVKEGVAPYSIERAATSAGYPVGPLQLADELNLQLMKKIAVATREALGVEEPNDYEQVVDTMIEIGRPSKLAGAGFYEYEDGKRKAIWTGLAEQFPIAEEQIPYSDVRDRQLFIEAIETAKTIEEGVITSAAAVNIGSIMGIGFPPNTGGAAQFMEGYEGKDGEIGLSAFIKRAEELAEAYGERFAPTQYLRDLAAKGEGFPA